MKTIITPKIFITLAKCTAAAMLFCFLLTSAGQLMAQPPCDAHFSSQRMPLPNTVLFQAIQSPVGCTYIWNYGDGVIDSTSGLVPLHTYSSPGTYYVCLTVNVSFFGTCTDSWCDSVIASPGPPPMCNAHFSNAPDTVANGILFFNAFNSGTATYAWDFGDGNTSSQQNPGHVYASKGAFYVCLTVNDSTFSGTCTDSWCDSVYVSALPPPVCDARFNSYSIIPQNRILFISAANAPTATYLWDFGDGATSTTPTNASAHTYALAGTYYVCLTVKDSTFAGTCSDVQCDSITVTMPPPPPPPVCNAQFSSNPLFPATRVLFESASNSPTAKYSWDFGDGNTSNNPFLVVHDYGAPGTYFACLTVNDSNAGGTCTDTQCDSVKIVLTPPSCTARFTAFKFYPANTALFTADQNPAFATYHWDFGDGDTSNQYITVHTYASPGTYFVCLNVNVTDFWGTCTDSWCDSVQPRLARPYQGTGDHSSSADIFPNPFSEKTTLHLQYTSGNVSFTLYDIRGRLVSQKTNLADGDYDLDRNNINNGMYFYKIYDGEDLISVGKLVIQ